MGENGHARLLVFDLETIYTRDGVIAKRIRQEAIEKRPAQNTLKELKLEWDTEAAREVRAREALRKTAVDRLLAEALCSSWRVDGAAFGVQMMDGGSEAERKGLELLSEAWQEQAGPETVWIGHNVLKFDLPICLNRWRHYDIRPPEHFPCFVNGRWHGRIYDTMQRTPCDNALGFVSFEDACEAYGVPGAKSLMWKGAPMSGERVADAYEDGAFDVIQTYCDGDVEINEALYHRMTCNDTWGTYDTRQQVADQLAEIEKSNLSLGEKAIAKVMVLENAGLLARA